MVTIQLIDGPSFSADPGETLLNAAARADLTLPYSCRTGRCSSCKCKIVSGETRALSDEIGLNVDERAAGWVLSCVRSAVTDVSLEVPELVTLNLPPAKMLPCRIHSIERLGSDVVRVMLRIPPTAEFSYLAGQYIDVIGEGGVRRSYSIANAAAGKKMIELHIREVAEGVMSQYWFNRANANDLLRLNGPLGTFFLRNVAGVRVVFLATGTGFAPVKAMIEGLSAMASTEAPASVHVFWGARTRKELYWDISHASEGVNFVPVLSRESDGWDGNRGYVQDAFLASSPDLANTVVYACGSDAMISGARSALVKAGLDQARFFSDAFVCSAN